MTHDAARRPAPTHTEVLDATRAAAAADPAANTQAIRVSPAAPVERTLDAEPASADPGQLPEPLVSRRVAAEVGMYVGAGLVVVAVGRAVADGWQAWEPVLRWIFFGLVSVALFAVGLFVRLPWRSVPSGQRRRAVSTLLTAATTGATAGVVLAWPAARDTTAGWPSVVVGLGVLSALLMVNLIARSPLSESALLCCLGWVAWITVPPGPWRWAALLGLGALWAAFGMRWARGRWAAGALGAGLALASAVPLAEGGAQWPVRTGLGALAGFGLVAFMRGRANYWLALGAGASTALAASVARDFVGPGPGLLIGGLATMAVSWIALRTAGSR